MRTFLFLLLAGMACAAPASSDGLRFSPDGKLMLPGDYRQWVFLSSGLGMTYGPAAQANPQNPNFDNVFVNPTAYQAFQASGRWPDKTIFILEIRGSRSKGSINNGGHFQANIISIEAAVKDETRFPQKWAYFGFGRGDRAAPLPASSQCNTCHSQKAAVENTFVQFYPTLLEVATKKGMLNPHYLREAQAH